MTNSTQNYKNTAGIEVPKWKVLWWPLNFWNGQEREFLQSCSIFSNIEDNEHKSAKETLVELYFCFFDGELHVNSDHDGDSRG